MNAVLAALLVGAESLLSLWFLSYALVQLWLARGSTRYVAPHLPTLLSDAGPSFVPVVTVQLPIFNERYVVEALLDAICALRYPRQSMEIQVLDDSTDETVELVAAVVVAKRTEGFDIHHLHRLTRIGYKAGALKEGLALARGELIALFDADFHPDPDFLLRTVPHFADPTVGVIQTRWGHDNVDHNTLTRLQALLLDAHFAIQQRGRNSLGLFMNFNGSAGVWRASAIRDAGDWSAQSLTEDLDLSFRAQLRGWRFRYLDDLVTPGQLPEDFLAFRIQQARWMRGVTQNAVRLVPRVLRASLPMRVRLHASAQLTESAMYVVTLLVPVLAAATALVPLPAWLQLWLAFAPPFLAGALLLGALYSLPQRTRYPGLRGFSRYLRVWLSFFTLTLGISLHNSIAVIQGLWSPGGEFARTPKGPSLRGEGGYRRRIGRGVVIELLVWSGLGVLLAAGVLQGVAYLQWLGIMAFLSWSIVLAQIGRELLRSQVTDAGSRATSAASP